ncbi:MAG: glycosyltransferase family 39 protein, partial [Deltaproteobacteria bacterium]|nr:glycosyltransferase family 39 protein [Deltaproteobacteria bacterium]
MSRQAREGALAPVLALWLALSAAAFALAIPGVEKPGLYYDEAFLAQQARGFVEPERAGQHPPSTREVTLAGRPFPLRNAAYMGSLKSQLLIPSLALFGSSTRVLRLTTLATGLLALLFSMLWARQLLGTPAALLTGLLMATDPGFLLFSRYEWGPYTSMLLCRSLGFFLVTLGLGAGSPAAQRAPRAGRPRT